MKNLLDNNLKEHILECSNWKKSRVMGRELAR
ncbi:MAG: hypothetical protein UV41_C0042G0009 [Candidatus Daviesbacteria bacterium GW2011_GWA2_42_7]|uniref:Uncharacterized protein n=1 Tax=Candidatus Daviesbacteria bacterium GW2011_GWA2_42_7 TaxID=1618425 RepID=A0A0G1B924_9BACT|nr:MAG: hypothetical protein UV41_C0042G0009 [Candidatus Daviesbacteria bacterium GW2011_GWA2_42_7]